MGVNLYPHQLKALASMKNGCILCGGVGSGKSITAIAHYYISQGASIWPELTKVKNRQPLYIITTARKRDTKEWEGELSHFLLNDGSVVIDSWNNIGKYTDVEKSFFIFDEQRVVGYGSWTKSFLAITRKNRWILLSATPGDCWMDYIPVFIANGFYKNKTEFVTRHCVYSRYSKYPKVEKYINEGLLLKHRNDILVKMDFDRRAVKHHESVMCDYDPKMYKETVNYRWNFRTNEPFENAAELCYELRRIVNGDISRQVRLLEIMEKCERAIVFYSFDYELDILKAMDFGNGVKVAEWNGHCHQPIPTSKRWVYLVQYTAGAEGWNCIETDTIIFYSQNYSYKSMVQASGRIDRLNTPYTDLYYYHFMSRSPIDIAISRALKNKKTFNEKNFVEGLSNDGRSYEDICKKRLQQCELERKG